MKILKYVGWKPESAVPQRRNVGRLLPTANAERRFRVYEDIHCMPEQRCVEGILHTMTRIRILADVIYVDQICATQIVLWENGCVSQCRGIIHGRDILEPHSAYAREFALLHALQTAQSWLQGHDQNLTQYINIEIGGPLTVYHLQKWLQAGQANFESAAASPILQLINEMGEWLQVNIGINSLYLPDRYDAEENVAIHKKIFLLLAERYRQFILPAQPSKWKLSPPVIPCTSAEMRKHIHQQFLTDERKIIDRLGNMDSESASIISYLDLTREVVREALEQLRGDRSHQVNLMAILSGTRFRMITKGGLLPTICPREGCQCRDSFWRLLTCYSLMDSVECGAFAVPFLVYIARKTTTSCPKQPWFVPSASPDASAMQS